MGKGINILNVLRGNIPSAWLGHEDFAVWLVKEMKPKVIVELGVELGFSTFALASPKIGKVPKVIVELGVELGFSTFALASPKIGKVYGVDWFKGDIFTKVPDTKRFFLAALDILKDKFNLNNIELIEGGFSKVAKTWKLPIDILHIDGSHRYKDVKRDFNAWSGFVKENGVILFHDINVPQDKRFGVERFFNEIDLPKFKFYHSFGLGVASRNKSIIRKIEKKYGKVKYKPRYLFPYA